MKKALQVSVLIFAMAVNGYCKLVLNVSPTNVVIRAGEPVDYSLELINAGETSLTGIFLKPSSQGYYGLRVFVKPPIGEEYLYVRSEIADLQSYKVEQIGAGEKRTGMIRILYNETMDGFVFDLPGQYDLRFVFRGDAVATAMVTVLEWDQESEQRSVAASRIWMQRDIARAHLGWELSANRIGDLERLTTEYSDTVYAQWAAELLERIEAPPKEAREERASRKLRTLSVSRGPPSLRNLSEYGTMLSAAHAVGRLSQEDIERSIRWAEEYLEFEGDRLSPENRKYVDDYLKLLRGLRNNGAAETQQ